MRIHALCEFMLYASFLLLETKTVKSPSKMFSIKQDHGKLWRVLGTFLLTSGVHHPRVPLFCTRALCLQAVPIRDQSILSKIHQTYRLGYIKVGSLSLRHNSHNLYSREKVPGCVAS